LLAGDYLTSFGLDRCCEELAAVTALGREHDVPFELSALVERTFPLGGRAGKAGKLLEGLGGANGPFRDPLPEQPVGDFAQRRVNVPAQRPELITTRRVIRQEAEARQDAPRRPAAGPSSSKTCGWAEFEPMSGTPSSMQPGYPPAKRIMHP
jgi:hypothetical protein